MARRKNRPNHTDACRKKIQTSQLVNRLTNHALGKLEKNMDNSQVTAALGLLKKSLPDLQSVELGNKAGESLKITWEE